MSKIKELRTAPENNINIVDLFSLLVPEGKSKYVETLIRFIKNTSNLTEFQSEIKKELSTVYGLKNVNLDEINGLTLIYYYVFLDKMFDRQDLLLFQKFCEYNERNLIDDNDLSTLKNFNDIKTSVELADLKINMRELESQVKKIHESSEWLVLRPLTLMASKKYGASTKWCTTMDDTTYFKRYTNNGILIYCINKLNGLKVAVYKDLGGGEFSFWNQADIRIDSLESELSDDIKKIIMTEIKNCPLPNYALLSDDQKKKVDSDDVVKKQMAPEPVGGFETDYNYITNFSNKK